MDFHHPNGEENRRRVEAKLDATVSDPEKGATDIGSVGGKDPTEDPPLEKVWRKVDLYILPVVAMFYLLSFLVSHLLQHVRRATHVAIGPYEFGECPRCRATERFKDDQQTIQHRVNGHLRSLYCCRIAIESAFESV